MENEQFPFLLIEQNKINQDESDFSDEKGKKNKKFELKKYEKFKPKILSEHDNNNLNLDRAENKVKTMLSLFLKDIQKEENKNLDILDNKKNINKISQKDLITNKFKRRELKRNTALSHLNSHLKYNLNKNYYNKNGCGSKNTNNFNNPNMGAQLKFNLNRLKREGLNNKISINILKKFMNNFNLENEGNIIKYGSLKKKSKIRSNIEGEQSPSRKNKNNNQINIINDSNIKNDLFNRNRKNRRKSSLSDSKNELIIPNELKDNNENNNKKLQIFSQNRKYSNISSSDIGTNRNYSHKNFLVKNNKNNSNINSNLNENLNIDETRETLFKNINKNNIFNESRNTNNTLLSEGSDRNIIQKSFENIKNMSSNNVNINKDIESNNIDRKNTNDKNSENIINSELENIKRSNTNNVEKKNVVKNKFYKQYIELRSIKKVLKKTIILRPEDLHINLKINNTSNKNIKNNKIKKANKKSVSLTNVPKVLTKIKKKKLGNINLNRKNKSSVNNIRVIVPKEKKEKKEKNEKNEKIKKKISEKILAAKKEIISNDDSLKILSSNIKSDNSIYNTKYRQLRRRANIYDSLDDEECEDAEEINHLFINPNSNFILFFDSILALSELISFIIVPFYLAKTLDFCKSKKNLYISIINIFIELLNIIDIFISFFRGYYDWEEQLIYRKRQIIKHYLGEWFLLDIISAIPFFTINKINEPICNEKQLTSLYYNQILNKPNYLLLCNRLFKIFKIFNNNQGYKYISNKLNEYISMLINIFFILLAINYAGCLYIFISRNCYPNWILNSKLDNSSFSEIYICSIYILMTAMTTVGYGDITCYCFWERVFQLFLLIVGILAYSWAVTSFSNYIKKINERSADFEKKKHILDEIKLSHQNLPDDLYDKILRFLKFKNFHEKKLKSIIFDCLPVSLKNNLICEMYKPIIKNFIFFKNFQNTDFIVRVILSFRPVIADKNDILINNNDMIEDIMFVKHGILSVELPLNMTNPQENIDKYINLSILNPQTRADLEKPGLLYSTVNNNLTNNIKNNKFKTTCLEMNRNNSSLRSTLAHFNSNIFGTTSRTPSFMNKLTFSDKEKDEIRYVKILSIRENEHFGDVLMFLEQRSPLRVRVKSRKAELFFLKKMDAIKISTSYPNIWRRINKKSIFNFEQIKKSINKIVEIYCSVKKLNSIEEENSNDIYTELIKQSKIGKKESTINIRPKQYEINPNMKVKKIRSKSYNHISNTSLKDFLKQNNIEGSTNNVRRRMAFSSKKVIPGLNIDKIINNNRKKLNKSSLSPKNRKKRIKKSVKFKDIINDIYNENYQFDQNVDNSDKNKSNNTIIEEIPEKEESNFKTTKLFQNIKKITNLHKDNNNKSLFNKLYENENENNDKYKLNQIIVNKNKNRKSHSLNFNKLFQKDVKTLKLDDSSSLQLINDENIDIEFNKSEENSSNYYASDKVINNEINPGEEIKVNKGDNLLFRKVNFFFPFKNNISINDIDNNNEHKNSKIEFLLNEDKELNKNTNIKDISINDNDNSSNNIFNIQKKESKDDLISNKNCVKKFLEDSLFINNNISFEYESSYENCNIISGNKLIKNKINQNKLKHYLINEILNKNINNRNSLFELEHNKTMNITYNNQAKLKEKDKEKIETIISNKQNKNKFQKTISFKADSIVLGSNFKLGQINRTSSFNENNIQKNKLKNNFQNDFNLSSKNLLLTQRKKFQTPKKKLLSTKNVSLYSALFVSPNEKNKKNVNKKTPTINKSKKKKDNLLSKINFNIQKTNENLNNPEEFYSNYFHSLLEGEIDRKNNIRSRMSMKVIPRFKKDKANVLKKNFTIKK